MTDECTFDEALPRAVGLILERFPELDLADCRFIRDMNGRLFVVVPDHLASDRLVAVRPALAARLGPYSAGPGGLACYQDTLSGEALRVAPMLVQYVGDRAVRLVERRVVGQDWAQLPRQVGAHPPRVVFFSLKGGVGRSTALFLWGRHLASQGRTVLLMDLDLEAPGLGAQLLPDADRPDFGILDWLVEDLVANPIAGPMVERMFARTPLAPTAGLYVVPATGSVANRHPADIIAKLARHIREMERQRGD